VTCEFFVGERQAILFSLEVGYEFCFRDSWVTRPEIGFPEVVAMVGQGFLGDPISNSDQGTSSGTSKVLYITLW
jgi:hypothetical protein